MASKRTETRFQREETVAHALQRLASRQRAQAEQAVRAFRDPAETIHKVRLTFKFLRALLKVTRAVTGERFSRSENARLRQAALALSPWRDATVIEQTLTKLGERMPKGPRQVMRDAVLQWQKKQHTQTTRKKTLKTTLREALAALKKFQQNLARKNWDQGGWEGVAEDLDKSYRKARRSLRLAEAAGVDESFHEARKRVKDLFYHVTLVELAEPDALPDLQKRLLKLQALLGKDHDVAIARIVLLHANPDAEKDYGDALEKLRDRTQRLRKKIHQQADSLFDADTKTSLRKARRELKKWPVAKA